MSGVISGDFVATLKISRDGNHRGRAGFAYAGADGDYIGAQAELYLTTFSSVWITRESNYIDYEIVTTSPVYFRLARAANDFTVEYEPGTGGGFQAPFSAVTEALATGGDLCMYMTYHDYEGQPAWFDDLQIVSGFVGTAQCLIGDVGTGVARHIDAGAGKVFDFTTIAATASNADVTWDVKESDTDTFDGTSWDYTDVTAAWLASNLTGSKRYLQLRANVAASVVASASPVLTEVTITTV